MTAYQNADQWKEFLFMEEGDESSSTPVEPVVQKCAMPTISYAYGRLMFDCTTDGVTFKSEITTADIRSYDTNEVQLGVTYNISVYATKAGYEDSDVVTATLCWIDRQPEAEGVETDVQQLQAKAVLVQGRNGVITVDGAEAGTSIAIYNLSGLMVGSATANGCMTTIETRLRKGEIAIVKLSDKAVKPRMQ